jgi:hypothetical protein
MSAVAEYVIASAATLKEEKAAFQVLQDITVVLNSQIIILSMLS